MSRDQLLCIVLPVETAHAVAIHSLLDCCMRRRLNHAIEQAGIFHFVSIALLPAPTARPGEASRPDLLIELTVDPQVPRRVAIDTLVRHALAELWELVSASLPAQQGAAPQGPALARWLLSHTSSADGGYVGTQERTVRQIREEARLFTAAQALAKQQRGPLDTSRELAEAVGVLAAAGTPHPVCRTPSPRNVWRRLPMAQRGRLLRAMLVVPGLFTAIVPLGLLALFGLAAIGAGGMVLGLEPVALDSLGVSSMTSVYPAILLVGGSALLLQLTAALVRLGALSNTGATMLLFSAGVFVLGTLGVMLSRGSTLEMFVVLLRLSAWGGGVALMVCLAGLAVLTAWVLSLLVTPPHLGMRGLWVSQALWLALAAVGLHLALAWTLDVAADRLQWRSFAQLRSATPLWGWMPAADAVVVLLLCFVGVGALLLRRGADLTGPVKAWVQAADRPGLYRIEAAQQSHASIDANAADLHGRVNHLISVTDVRGGTSLHVFALRGVLRLIGLLGRTLFTDGMLGYAAGIHFGHWHVIDGGRRLLFCSNYDGSTGGYLDEFIGGASQGINLIWRWTELRPRGPAIPPMAGQMPHPGVQRYRAFPPTLLGLFRGCRHELWFKAFARDSMVPHLYRFEAYTHSNQSVERATRLRDALHSRRVAQQRQRPTAVHDDHIMRCIES